MSPKISPEHPPRHPHPLRLPNILDPSPPKIFLSFCFIYTFPQHKRIPSSPSWLFELIHALISSLSPMDCRRPEPSYYAVLGVRPDATSDEIRKAYRNLAMKWHPDRWRKRSDDHRLLDEANRKFQSIHEAYQVLSDRSKRTLYDAGMYDDEEEEVEGFAEFVEEMVKLMADLRREEGVCGLPELRAMLDDMARSFQSPAAAPPVGCVGGAAETRGSKRVRREEAGFSRGGIASGLGLFGSASCC